jgi:hypothetical protein
LSTAFKLLAEQYQSVFEEIKPELLLKGIDPGRADASAEKAEASPIVETLRATGKGPEKKQRRERWPEELAVEQEVIEPEEVKENPEAFRCR